uniref:Uncharacterized protein n=1 Tax=Chromera velia CCMP2878 TaxID=1169474 RepID=A0A0G4G5N1_9ALVE|eukprot:Cvel_20329.t1-p1 / transcript=Cvel_20329.t1 / gene=Cvel_20329 / organism=Chromera_velia_CCMP2878 / gene_product=hypothetical protein / transcript_product=hypothetical protein / location=Cvel_scaffold1816:5278-6798(-) / protein_length=471 / sequence_SO=supercontig / SO=protein_coding / is_pseudo=false
MAAVGKRAASLIAQYMAKHNPWIGRIHRDYCGWGLAFDKDAEHFAYCEFQDGYPYPEENHEKWKTEKEFVAWLESKTEKFFETQQNQPLTFEMLSECLSNLVKEDPEVLKTAKELPFSSPTELLLLGPEAEESASGSVCVMSPPMDFSDLEAQMVKDSDVSVILFGGQKPEKLQVNLVGCPLLSAGGASVLISSFGENLQGVRISQPQWTMEEVVSLCEEFPALKTFYLDSPRFDSVSKLSETLPPSVEDLRLSFELKEGEEKNSMSIEWDKLGSRLPNLKRLAFSYYVYSPSPETKKKETASFCGALRKFSQLETLGTENLPVSIDSLDIPKVFRTLGHTVGNLKEVYVYDECNQDGAKAKEGLLRDDDVIELAKGCSKLEVFSVQFSSCITEKGVEKLLELCPSVHTLLLDGADGLSKHVFSVLDKYVYRLKKVNVSSYWSNRIEKEDVKRFADRHPQLKVESRELWEW